MTKPEVDLA